MDRNPPVTDHESDLRELEKLNIHIADNLRAMTLLVGKRSVEAIYDRYRLQSRIKKLNDLRWKLLTKINEHDRRRK